MDHVSPYLAKKRISPGIRRILESPVQGPYLGNVRLACELHFMLYRRIVKEETTIWGDPHEHNITIHYMTIFSHEDIVCHNSQEMHLLKNLLKGMKDTCVFNEDKLFPIFFQDRIPTWKGHPYNRRLTYATDGYNVVVTCRFLWTRQVYMIKILKEDFDRWLFECIANYSIPIIA